MFYIVSFVLLTFTAIHKLAFNELVQYIYISPTLCSPNAVLFFAFILFLLRGKRIPSEVNGPYVRYVNCTCVRNRYIVRQSDSRGHAQCTNITSSLNFRAFYTKAQSLSVLNHKCFFEWQSTHTSPLESPAFSTAWMPMCTPL